jgi:hypothetical protein
MAVACSNSGFFGHIWTFLELGSREARFRGNVGGIAIAYLKDLLA